MRPGAIEVSDVVFVALGCGADVAHELVEGLPDAFVSHDNCVHQSVICAHPDAIATAMARAKERKVLAQELPFRSGFHSPLFEPFVAGLAAQFESLPLQVPSVPMWSATTCEPYPHDHDGIAALALKHLVAPVRFRELAEALHDDGVRVFVQVGTGSLGGFVDDTLRDREYIVVPTNVAKQTGMGQLRRAAAALWVEGVDVDFSALDVTPHATPSSPRSSGRAAPLPLGSSLIRDLEPLDARMSRSVDVPAGSPPAVNEFRAALDDATEAARAVLDAVAARGGMPAVARPTTPAAPVAPVVPAAHGEPTGEPGVTTRHLSLEVEPAWADHAFFAQPEGWPHQADRFPLVPMTGIL
jgi:hypothetical protein